MANRSRAAEQQQNMARPKKRFSTATDYGPSEHTPDGASEDQEWNSPRMPMTERVKRVRTSEEKNGWIKCIELQDFMCHHHLKVTLNSTINFITGNNGSGKSALLTALTVCLGGRASTTQRASSLASLVREGAEYSNQTSMLILTSVRVATVRVTLANAGEFNAFRPERYGDAIIIERRFGSQGGSANRYATFNASGRLVCDRREEVAQICDHFGIQVDNPLAVLSQETAKRFLASTKPKELYEATQLEQLAADHGYSVDRITTASQRIGAIRETWSGKEARVAELEGLLKEVMRQKEIRQRLNEVKAQLAWKVIADKEAAVDDAAAEAERREEKLLRLDGDREKIVERAASIQDEIAEHQKEANVLSVDLEPLQRSYDVLTQRLGEARSGKTRIEADIREVNSAFKEEGRNRDRVQKALEEELGRDGGADQQRISEQISSCQSAIVAINSAAAEDRAVGERLKEQREQVNAKLAKARDYAQERSQAYDSRRHQLESLKRAQQNRLLAFHERMPQLMADIQSAAGSFHRAPVGPIGQYIKLNEPKWALPIEALIGKELEGFIVKDSHDHDKLRGLMARHRIYAPIIIIGSDTPLDFSRDEPPPLFMTALRALTINHPLVLKALIINAGIERAVLMPDRNSAKDALRRRDRTNADSAFTDKERVFVSATSSSSNVLFSNGKIDLIRDRGARLQELEVEVREMGRQVESVRRDVKNVEAEAASLAQEISALENRAMQRERELHNQRRRLKTLEDEQSAVGSLTLGALQEDLRACQERLDTLETQFTDLMASAQERASQMKAIEQEMAANMEQQAAIKEQHEQVLEDLHRASTFRRNVDKELGLLDRAKDLARAELEAAKAKQSRLASEVEEAKKDVAFLGERVSTKQSRAELERELTRLKAVLEELVKTQPDPAALLAEITELKDSLARSKRLVESESHLLDKMQRTLEQRKIMWNVFRKHIGKISNMEFILMLQARGFQGRLEYDAVQKTLNIRVKPQAQVAADSVAKAQQQRNNNVTAPQAEDTATERDIRQLSGGEKSYSTACFLFSLWTAMASPIRALDEFDVFMDQVNRDFVINELMKNARSSKVQFILITPNAIWNSIKGYSDDTKIIRLENPHRQQNIAA